jgi:peptidyl-prolyl cis-trans isomerase B (cyclophilin B)
MPSNKRQKELARRRAERQAARRAAERAKRRRRRVWGVLSVTGAALGVALILLLVNVLGGDGKKKSDPNAGGPCQVVKNDSENTGGKKPGLPPAPAFGENKALDAKLVLTQGTVELQLFGDRAPCAANSFRFLAQQKFFDGGLCHRETATEGLIVLQCGDPTASGSGGPGYTFKDENLPTAGPAGTAVYPRGTVAMANSGASTNGSQFFLVIKDSQLPPNYTVFGKVVKGLDVLDKIAAKGLKDDNGSGDGKPKEDVKITSATVTP